MSKRHTEEDYATALALAKGDKKAAADLLGVKKRAFNHRLQRCPELADIQALEQEKLLSTASGCLQDLYCDPNTPPALRFAAAKAVLQHHYSFMVTKGDMLVYQAKQALKTGA